MLQMPVALQMKMLRDTYGIVHLFSIHDDFFGGSGNSGKFHFENLIHGYTKAISFDVKTDCIF